MKYVSFAKLLTLACFALALPVACGDDDDKPAPEAAAGQSGSGGEGGGVPEIPGTSATPETIQCATEECKSTSTLAGNFLDPCCTAGERACGVDSGFLTLLDVDLGGACLAKAQPGEEDATCPDSTGKTVPYQSFMVNVKPFKGCCRPDNTCGYLVNTVDTNLGEFTAPELGCVDSSVFGAPVTGCGGGVGGGGAGGGGNEAGAGGAVSESGAGGVAVGGVGGAL
jgi:hypothetical protein